MPRCALASYREDRALGRRDGGALRQTRRAAAHLRRKSAGGAARRARAAGPADLWSGGVSMSEGYDERRGTPAGEVYDWYRRGVALLDSGNPAAAAHLLERAQLGEPDSLSIREALARALFDAGRYEAAADAFGSIIASRPDDDYARFGLGLTLSRLGRPGAAVEHLAMAAVMRPQRREYLEALRQARATLKARGEGS